MAEGAASAPVVDPYGNDPSFQVMPSTGNDAAAQRAAPAITADPYAGDPSALQSSTPTAASTPAPVGADGVATRPAEADGDFLSRTWHSLKDAATGASRTEFPNVPELSEMGADSGLGKWDASALKLAAGYLTSSTPQQIADIAKNTLPGSTVSADKFGNPMITWKGQTYYANKPGLSTADIASTTGTMAPAALAATGVGAIPALAGRTIAALGLRSLVQGVGQGAVSLARDYGATTLGSEQGTSLARAGEAAAGGAVAEPAASLGSNIGSGLRYYWDRLFGGRGSLIGDIGNAAGSDPVTSDMLTETGKAVLKKAGLDPTAPNLTVDQLQAVNKTVGAAAPEVTAQTVAPGGTTTAAKAVQSARTGIPFTAAQLTGDPTQLAAEDLARRGTARPLYDAFTDRQMRAGVDAASNLIPGVAGGPVPTENAIGNALGQAAQQRAAQLKQASGDAWAKLPYFTKVGMATEDTPSATFSSGASDAMLARMQDIARRYAITGNPHAEASQKLISQLITNPSEGAAPGVEGVAAMNAAEPPGPLTMTRPFNLADAGTTLRQLRARYESAGSDGERAAIGAMRGAVNDSMDAATMNGLVSGDPNAIALWKAAKAARVEQGNFMEPDSNVAKQFMENVTSGHLTGQEVVNGLYGAGQLGSTGTGQILDHLETQFPVGSPQWEMVRQAGMRRMLFGSTEKTAEMSPNNLANRINEGLTGNGQAISEKLFNPDEIEALQNLRDSMNTLQQSAGRNPSKTAYEAGNMIRGVAKRIPVIGGAFNDEARAYALARAATGGDSASGPVLTPAMMRRTDVPLGAFQQAQRIGAPVAGGLLMSQPSQQP